MPSNSTYQLARWQDATRTRNFSSYRTHHKKSLLRVSPQCPSIAQPISSLAQDVAVRRSPSEHQSSNSVYTLLSDAIRAAIDQALLRRQRIASWNHGIVDLELSNRGTIKMVQMNVFRVLADVFHTASKLILIWAIHSNQSAEG